MTLDDILDDILAREGEGVFPYLAPGDAGGRTSWGISERAHPDLWQPGPPTRAQARVRYTLQYVAPFDSLVAHGIYDPLRVALIDDAVLSGEDAARKRLQWVLNVKRDGLFGPKTFAAIRARAGRELLQAYVVERACRLARLVQRRPTDLPSLHGWIRRALTFLPEAI